MNRLFGSRVVYSVDLKVAGMFAGAGLDAWTTWLVVSHHYGVEANPVLAALTRCSMVWTPAYILCRPLLVPLIPEPSRAAFAFFFTVLGLLLGLNNLAGILYGHYFLVDTLGLPQVFTGCVLAAVVYFGWRLCRHTRDLQERRRHVSTGLFWIGVFGLIELGFYAAGRLLPN